MSARTYELSPRDRTGVLLGLSGLQVTVLGCALTIFVALVAVGAAGVGAGVGLAIALTAIPVRDQTIVQLAPSLARRGVLALRAPRPWLASLPPVDGTSPAALAGQTIRAVDAGAHFPGRLAPVAVAHDRRSHRLAVTLRGQGRRFTLLDRDDQDHQLQRWSAALAPLAAAGSPVVAVRWCESTAPGDLEEHFGWLEEHDPPDDDAAQEYRHFLDAVGPAVVDHDVLLTLAVSDRAVAGRRGASASAVDALLGEARLLAERLETAGIAVDGPLSPPELRDAIRVRLDPTCRSTLARRARTLGERAGGVTAANAGPLAATATWSQWCCDSTLHRAFYIAEWPRTPVAADALAGLLLHNGVVRTVAVTYEPVPRVQSRRRIERQVTRLSTDAEQRTRAGFRVDAAHQRATQSVLDREHELVGGHAEFAYVGVIDVCAGTVEELDRAAADLVQVAAAAGLELRPLHGRHDLAVATTLPLARTVAAKGLLA